MSKLSSNHKPIILQFIDDEDLGPIPFKFSPLWVDKEGFVDTVSNAWKIPVSGSPNFLSKMKLKQTKSVLKEWIKFSSHSPISDRILVVARLDEIQMLMEDVEISPSIPTEEQEAQLNASKAFRKEEEYWRLKSWNLWLIAEDKNTSFFHKQYRSRLSHNHISEITSPSGESFKGITHLK